MKFLEMDSRRFLPSLRTVAAMACAVTLLAGLAPSASAQITFTTQPGPGGVIPDNDTNGISSLITISGFNPGTITSINSVTITGLTHPYSGDLTAVFLKRDPNNPNQAIRIVDLFDRVGAVSQSDAGSPANFNGTYTFVREGANLGSLANTLATGSNIPSGSYAPDPNTAGGITGYSGDFDVFNGIDVNGVWELQIADTNTGEGPGSFTSWNFNVSVVPEPGTMALLGTGLMPLAGMVLRRRRLKSRSAQTEA